MIVKETPQEEFSTTKQQLQCFTCLSMCREDKALCNLERPSHCLIRTGPMGREGNHLVSSHDSNLGKCQALATMECQRKQFGLGMGVLMDDNNFSLGRLELELCHFCTHLSLHLMHTIASMALTSCMFGQRSTREEMQVKSSCHPLLRPLL